MLPHRIISVIGMGGKIKNKKAKKPITNFFSKGIFQLYIILDYAVKVVIYLLCRILNYTTFRIFHRHLPVLRPAEAFVAFSDKIEIIIVVRNVWTTLPILCLDFVLGQFNTHY